MALFFGAESIINQKTKAMAQNRNSDNKNSNSNRQQDSIGNQQRTTQTGAQNAGGENIEQEEDRYTEDLQRSGDRNSSNRKNEGNTGR